VIKFSSFQLKCFELIDNEEISSRMLFIKLVTSSLYVTALSACSVSIM